jgi:hypothetical protein
MKVKYGNDIIKKYENDNENDLTSFWLFSHFTIFGR